ncbi:unnamed protein product [Musa acuminata subsp. burmannicoides]|uniref:(wild Malaysian banana) hypothetical protein n=1 Tax=Musa acuminata subsp. malaccensis TaxID=214687 RepID=A0A804I5S5_MUSAM|nr:unnamed protein product [Musa acuminata subsp. malaccensis]
MSCSSSMCSVCIIELDLHSRKHNDPMFPQCGSVGPQVANPFGGISLPKKTTAGVVRRHSTPSVPRSRFGAPPAVPPVHSPSPLASEHPQAIRQALHPSSMDASGAGERSSCHANYFNRDSRPYPSSSPDAMHAINPKIWTDHVIIDSDLSSLRAWGAGAVKPAMRSPLNSSNPHLPSVLYVSVLRFRFGAKLTSPSKRAPSVH